MSYLTERREEEKLRRREQILDAAEAVAARVGWDETTMDEVAREARLSRALVYLYFIDRTDLLFGLRQRALLLLAQLAKQQLPEGATGLACTISILQTHVAFFRKHEVYAQVVARGVLAPRPRQRSADLNRHACARIEAAVLDLLADALAAGMSDGSIPTDIGEPKKIAPTLRAMLQGVMLAAVAEALATELQEPGVEQLAHHCLRMITRSLSSNTP